jgi:hypothetical protein
MTKAGEWKIPDTGINSTYSVLKDDEVVHQRKVQDAGLVQVFPNDSPRIGSYSGEGEWKIPKSPLEKLK